MTEMVDLQVFETTGYFKPVWEACGSGIHCVIVALVDQASDDFLELLKTLFLGDADGTGQVGRVVHVAHRFVAAAADEVVP